MKRFLITVFVFCLTLNLSFADEFHLDKETQYQKRIMQIGYRILNANQIERRMVFHYDNSKEVNAFAVPSTKQIRVTKGILPYMDDDNELAAIMCHEIAHGLDFYGGYFRRIAMELNSKKYERKADIKAIDLMVNAGYNPVALITIMNKIFAEPDWYEPTLTHPAGSDRLAYIYEHIYAKYPAYLADNEYKTNIYYQNFLLTSKKSRELIRQKYAQQNEVNVSNKHSKKSN